MRRFTIKICGITRPEDACGAAAAGADAIGLNFYAKSPRAIDTARARTIIAALPLGVVKAGVFVNAPREEVCAIYNELVLDFVQLHGDEPPEYLAKLGGMPVIKAFRAAGAEGLKSMVEYIDACRALGCVPAIVLLDAPLTDSFGGSGKLADWALAKEYVVRLGLPPLLLAGGLNAENVGEAIRATGAAAVDTASGVESQAGIKDAGKIAAFVSAAKGTGQTARGVCAQN